MGRILFHKYELIRLLGFGGAGKVYLALDRHLGRLVAVKESHEKASLAEMELLRELEHPGLPEIYDYFKEQGSNWLIMEYIEGMSLRQYLDKHKRVKEKQAVRWMLELCEILKYLHGRHPAVIYRDLKPENIMIKQNGKLKLIDLGGAIRHACGRENRDICAGTPGYCPGQQWTDVRGDVSWDIYALGVVLHEMLTGDSPAKPPYERRSLSEYDRSLSGTLDKIISCCTSKKGAYGYHSIEQVEEALLGCHKRSLKPKLWKMMKKFIIIACASVTAACFALPLLEGIPENHFPFPYLYKSLFFLSVTLFFYLIFFKVKPNKKFLIRQEKNIWLTKKQFSGLLSLFIFLCAGALGLGGGHMSSANAHAEAKEELLWVEMRDEYGRKLLLKNDAVYITKDCVRLELPVQRMPEKEFSLQMIAVCENGNVYSSRLFHIKAQEDLN